MKIGKNTYMYRLLEAAFACVDFRKMRRAYVCTKNRYYVIATV